MAHSGKNCLSYMISRWGVLAVAFALAACSKDPIIGNNGLLNDNPKGPTPYYLKIPPNFPDYFLDEDKRLTEEGIALGRMLFYDPILSRNKNVSCASCHKQENAFSDPRPKSVGTHGDETKFHSMPLANIAWMDQFFWDGRAPTREAQALQPVVNPVEMDMTWPEAVERLQNHPEYPHLFKAAFGTDRIDSNLVTQALVQFEMTIVSADSKFDRYLRGETTLTPTEDSGYTAFLDLGGGDCIHCHHPTNPHFADNTFHNNGLDSQDKVLSGLMAVTGNAEDEGKFKTPSLRNLAFTAPYMHDGRFETLEEVLDFYSTGVNHYPTVDPKMEFSHVGGVHLSPDQKRQIIAFLLTLTDSSVVKNPAYADPFK